MESDSNVCSSRLYRGVIMQITNIQSSTSLVRAVINNFLQKEFYNNHKVVLRTRSGQQAFSSSSKEIVTLKNEPILKAYIIKNSDV